MSVLHFDSATEQSDEIVLGGFLKSSFAVVSRREDFKSPLDSHCRRSKTRIGLKVPMSRSCTRARDSRTCSRGCGKWRNGWRQSRTYSARSITPFCSPGQWQIVRHVSDLYRSVQGQSNNQHKTLTIAHCCTLRRHAHLMGK